MSAFSTDVLMAGIVSTIVGLILQAIGRVAFSRYKADDTKELAGVVGFRVSAIFGIAVGLIFGSTTAHFVEAKKNLLEETRLMGTLYVLAASAPELPNSRPVRDDLRQYMKVSATELDNPELAAESDDDTNRLLLNICRQMAPDSQDSAQTLWLKTEFQRSCAKLIDARGTKRTGTAEKLITSPFWAFYFISFGFLAILFGVFDTRPINIIFSSLFYFATGVTAMLIYAAGDPYHDPGRISSSPLTQLIVETEQFDKRQQLDEPLKQRPADRT